MDPKMPNETTQEQAVKIAEFLGLRPIPTCLDHQLIPWSIEGSWDNKVIYENKLYEWLSSPEGEVAMMDKLEELRLDIDNLMCAGKDRKRCICLYIGKLVPYGDRWRGTAKTRNAALRLAILKMLEGKK